MNPTEPIKKRKLSDEVLERLLMIFESGELKPDDEMPSERELMERFQVGRPAVREALQSLERMGLIMIRHGERAKVLRPTEDGIFDQIDFTARQLLATSDQNVEFLREARQIMEAGIVRLAAVRATPGGIATLKKHLAAMRASKGQRGAFVENDQRFHLALAKMTGNPILNTTMRAMFRWLAHYHTDIFLAPGLEDLTIQEHEALLERIEARDAEGASQQVSDHILRVNDLYAKTDPS